MPSTQPHCDTLQVLLMFDSKMKSLKSHAAAFLQLRCKLCAHVICDSLDVVMHGFQGAGLT